MKTNNPITKCAEDLNRQLIKENTQMASKQTKKRSITCRQGIVNQNNKTPLHTYQNGSNPKSCQHQMLVRMWKYRKSHSLLVEMQNGTLWKAVWQFLTYKTRHIHTHDTALWYLPNEIKIYVYTKSCTQIFTALFS